MPRRLSLAILILLPLSSMAAERKDESVEDNAALVYWQAFSLMQRFITSEEDKALQDWPAARHDKRLAGLLDRPAVISALKHLHCAADVEHCFWGVKRDLRQEGPLGASMQHLFAGRTLAHIALLRAGDHFKHGRSRDAFDDIIAVQVLARRLGRDESVGKIVDVITQKRAIELAAEHLPAVKDRDLLKSVLARQAALPKPRAAIDLVREEKGYLVGWLRRFKGREDRIPSLWGGRTGEEALTETFKSELQKKGLDKLCDEVAAMYDEMVKSGVPAPELLAEVDLAFTVKQLESGNALVQVLIHFPKSLYNWEYQDRTRQQLFKAALGMMIHGQDALRSFKDPYGDEPFEYSKLATGFELKSKLKDQQARPIILTVSPPP